MERNFLERLEAAENFLERLSVIGEQTIRNATTFGHPLSMSPPGILYNSAAAMPSFLDEIVRAEESMRRLSGPVGYDESGRLVSGAGKVAMQEFINREDGPGSAAMTEAATRGAALAGGTSLVGSAPKGALRSMSLRDRYGRALRHAADGKDPRRIKLTPERIEAAKNYLKHGPWSRRELWGDMTDAEIAAFKHRQTPQMLNARAFAEEAIRRGEKIRFKMPDGKQGSLYIRVGDKGTVRFSDHSAPTEWVGDTKQVTGGYSETLGRRHYPASLSVDPRGASFADAMKWLDEKTPLPMDEASRMAK